MGGNDNAVIGNAALRVSLLAAALLTLAGFAAKASAAMPTMSEEGWHSWQVEAHSEAPDWCCFSWSGGVVRGKGCSLDEGARNHGSISGTDDYGINAHPGHMQIYVRIAGGKATEVHAFSTSCPVTSTASIADHGLLKTADSVAWLSNHIGDNTGLSSSALAAIGVHEGAAARRALVTTAGSDSRLANRKHAVFWMGQTRGVETGDDIKALMFRDNSRKMREHAAFSLSQSNAAGRADALRQLATTDRHPEVRGKAWFWLAQTDDSGSGAAMLAALESETNREVLNELVFAISQLPGDQGANTLIAVIENRRLPEKLRSRAVFWIAQHDSERASEYLGAVFKDLP